MSKRPFDPKVYLAEGSDLPDSFLLEWDAAGWGFGEFGFRRVRELVGAPSIYIGDEYMGLPNVRKGLENYCAQKPQAEWPMLLKDYGSIDLLMLAVTDWESKGA